MQNIKSKISKCRYILYAAPVIFGLLSLPYSNNTSALSSQSNTNVQFTFSPTISLNVSGDLSIDELLPGNSADSNIITIDVNTNSLAGYTLTTTVGKKAETSGVGNPDTYLTNTGNSNYKFTNLSSTITDLSDFQDNTWGYSYSVDNGTTWISGSYGSTANGYNGLPQDNNANPQEKGKGGITLLDINSNADTEVKFKIGAKASTYQPAGQYTNTINFYAIAKIPPVSFSEAYATYNKQQYNGYYTMQDMSTDICSAVELYGDDSATTLIDTRDNETYTVAKINGQCWMTQNLRFQQNSVFSATSNVASDNAITWYSLKNNANSPDSRCYASESGGNGNNNACKEDYEDASTGTWYNYYGATAGTISGDSNSVDATQDICPKNWHMPSSPNVVANTDINKLIGNTIDGWQNPTAGLQALHATNGGNYYNGSRYNARRGYWWTTTAAGTTGRYYLRYDSNIRQFNGSNSDINRYIGIFVRCLAR